MTQDRESDVINSLDQTTRIHGPLPSKPSNVWREIARPQVHGYDLIGVQFLDALKFISIADEKVARVFEAPKGFVRLVKNLQVTEIEVDEVNPFFPCIARHLSRSSGRETCWSDRSAVRFIQ